MSIADCYLKAGQECDNQHFQHWFICEAAALRATWPGGPTCFWLAWSCPHLRGEVLVHQPEGCFVPVYLCRAAGTIGTHGAPLQPLHHLCGPPDGEAAGVGGRW